MATVSTVTAGEAAVYTINGGTEIELRLPNGGDADSIPDGYPPMMKFLAAVVLRADHDFGWWQDQVRWYEEFVAHRHFIQTRVQLRCFDNKKSTGATPDPPKKAPRLCE